MRNQGLATVAQLSEFDEVIDARSPAEYLDDHLPRAISCPVLDDEQRARVGTLYVQSSPFEAKKIGAALVARNIADHIERLFLDRPREWRPLVYCWRGGQRSGAFVHILRQIGWDAHKLSGGYKVWRRQVIDELATLPERFSFRVLAGATGSGKSRVLEALVAHGAQVLHLEELAGHKGSVLGDLPHASQPSQRTFESRIHTVLSQFDSARRVYVEAESRRIGAVQLPNALIDAMRAAQNIRIESTLVARTEFLVRDYQYLLDDRPALIEILRQLQALHSKETLAHWIGLVEAGEFATLVGELLLRHYDPLYQRSQANNYAGLAKARTFATDDLSPGAIVSLAQEIDAATESDRLACNQPPAHQDSTNRSP